MTIEKMTLGDIPAVYRLGTREDAFKVKSKDCFWTRKQLKRWVLADKDVLLVARNYRRVVGFTLSSFHQPTGKVTWENLYVVPQFRHHGVASRLIERLLLELKIKGASVVCGIVRTKYFNNIGYFRRKGFDVGYKFTWISKDF